jgi:hypothetical protein
MTKLATITMAVVLLGGGIAAADEPNKDTAKDKAPATQPSAPVKPDPDAGGSKGAPQVPPGETAVTAEVKAGTGVENRAIVGESHEFTAGTRVWIWSRIANAKGRTAQHRWRRDGTDFWTANLKVGSNKYSTNSRRNVRAGKWTVDVIVDGETLATARFVVN